VAYLNKTWTNRYVAVVHADDLTEARRIAVDAAMEALDLTAGGAEAERQSFVPVPGRPGLYWLATAAFPGLRVAVQKRLGRLTKDVYFAWLDRDGSLLVDQSGNPEAGKITPGGQVVKGAKGDTRKNKKLRRDDVLADVDELLR